MPKDFSHEVRDFILRLLTKEPHRRLGARGAYEVNHSADCSSYDSIEMLRNRGVRFPFATLCWQQVALAEKKGSPEMDPSANQVVHEEVTKCRNYRLQKN